MKNMHRVLRVAALLLAVLALSLAATACSTVADASPDTFAVTVNGATINPDLDMAIVLSTIGEQYSYGESSACPPFSGTEKLYDFASVKITTYEKNGSDFVMGIFLKDDSLNVSGVKIGMTVAEMQEKLGEGKVSGSAYIYSSKSGATLKCVARDGVVMSINVLTAQADD